MTSRGRVISTVNQPCKLKHFRYTDYKDDSETKQTYLFIPAAEYTVASWHELGPNLTLTGGEIIKTNKQGKQRPFWTANEWPVQRAIMRGSLAWRVSRLVLQDQPRPKRSGSEDNTQTLAPLFSISASAVWKRRSRTPGKILCRSSGWKPPRLEAELFCFLVFFLKKTWTYHVYQIKVSSLGAFILVMIRAYIMFMLRINVRV